MRKGKNVESEGGRRWEIWNEWSGMKKGKVKENEKIE